MTKYVAFKFNVGTVTVATEPGSILQFDHEVYYSKGDYIFTGLDGKQHIIPDSNIDDYIEVEVKKKKIDKNDMANAYANMENWLSETEEDNTYINGTRDLAELKKK
ncbi:hypothetical protein AAHH67_16220 [Niallia circulans]